MSAADRTLTVPSRMRRFAQAAALAHAGAAFLILGSVATAAGSSMAAPMPAGLKCGAVKPVWVNTATHVYHLSSDPEYGRTKSGTYMCASQAVAAGNRRAGKPAPMSSPSPRS